MIHCSFNRATITDLHQPVIFYTINAVYLFIEIWFSINCIIIILLYGACQSNVQYNTRPDTQTYTPACKPWSDFHFNRSRWHIRRRATDRTKVHRHGFYTRDRVLFIYSDQDILAKIDRAIYSVSAITKLIVSFHLFRNHLRAMRERSTVARQLNRWKVII